MLATGRGLDTSMLLQRVAKDKMEGLETIKQKEHANT
jgi:hypothetical protein